MLLTNENWHESQNQYPNFAAHELASKDSGLVRVSLRFMKELQYLRSELELPISINSGCRTRTHNTRVGGHPRSLHICDEHRLFRGNRGVLPPALDIQGSLAVDIRTDHSNRGDLFSLAWEEGWSIGWGKGFLHLDRRIWLGLPQRTFDY